ncbi:MAG: DUF1343 domain-containing protein [Bacteroidetes bacterium]|nr:DUF1343 domain-containing protein [Bacteroidota bacterium]
MRILISKKRFLFLLLAQLNILVFAQQRKTVTEILSGADNTESYLQLIRNSAVAIVTNQTGVIGNKTHIVDSLLTRGINVKKIFAPEHGFRGVADAGEHLKSGKDKRTGLPIVSLYGKNYKPNAADLQDVDVVLFDIQDVGARFYTYISTLHYVMEACAENNKQLIVLDRPNPNGFYIDGPVLEEKNKSFVGMHPVPIVYGMTIGEYAKMINGEEWLANKMKCNLIVIPLTNYSHSDLYELPIKPSPNLPNNTAIYLYPSLALFEGTNVSVGRGTNFPFQVVGKPGLKKMKFSFTPISTQGAKEPMHKNIKCYGYDLRSDTTAVSSRKINLFWLMESYKLSVEKEKYFNNYFNSLAGNATLKQQVIDGVSEENIRKSWEGDLQKFKQIRKKYLLYDDFKE